MRLGAISTLDVVAIITVVCALSDSVGTKLCMSAFTASVFIFLPRVLPWIAQLDMAGCPTTVLPVLTTPLGVRFAIRHSRRSLHCVSPPALPLNWNNSTPPIDPAFSPCLWWTSDGVRQKLQDWRSSMQAVFMKAFMTAVGHRTACAPSCPKSLAWHGYELLIKPLFVLGGRRPGRCLAIQPER